MFHLRRNQVCTSRNWKPSQRQILSKDTGPFIQANFFSRCFYHIFAITNQLACFSISWLARVEEFFNVYICFKYYIYILNVNMYVSTRDYLFKYIKISFLLPHLFCNVEYELRWFHNTKQSLKIFLLKIEMLLEFQNELNIIIIGY